MVPSLTAISGLIKNHSRALLDTAAVAGSPTGGGGGETTDGGGERKAEEGVGVVVRVGGEGDRGGSAGVIARGIFEELHLPALSQSIRQVCLCLCCSERPVQ